MLTPAEQVVLWCRARGLPEPIPEYRFFPPRRWRFDLAWPDQLIALEIEGGVWTGGRHTRAPGFLRDMEKYNTAAAYGWRLLRATPAQVEGGTAYGWLDMVLPAAP